MTQADNGQIILEAVAHERFHPTNGWQPVSRDDAPYYVGQGQDIRALTPLAPAQGEIERVSSERDELRKAYLAAESDAMVLRSMKSTLSKLAEENAARALAAEERVKVLSEALRRARRYVADLPIVGDADLALIDAALSAAPAREVEPVECPACYRGEVFGMSLDDGFWVEMSSVAGGANEHGANGWIELIEHYPDGREVRREYVAKDSPLYAHPPALKVEEVARIIRDNVDAELVGTREDRAEVVGIEEAARVIVASWGFVA